MLAGLHLSTWRQFGAVDIDFHDRLTILTGANGAGKTTILSMLSQHFGWTLSFLSEPSIDRKGALRYYSGATDIPESGGGRQVVGSLLYSDGHESVISVPQQVAANYDVAIENRRSIPGLYLPSHRPVYSYQPVNEIPTQVSAREELFEQYLTNLRSFWVSNSRTESPSLRLKRALISLATFGYGNEAVEPNLEARETFEGFQRILTVVLPNHIGFRKLTVRAPEIVLQTDSGDFSLDAASGGVAALIDLAWQMYMRSLTVDHGPFVVIADEPENHLHPALQREVMPKLLAAFPSAQFIVATHNPFVVSSVRDSSVFALRFDNRRVVSDRLDLVEKAGTANDVLREVLGVPVPLPIWVEQAVDALVGSINPSDVSAESVQRLKDGLDEMGAGRQFALALNRILGSHAPPD